MSEEEIWCASDFVTVKTETPEMSEEEIVPKDDLVADKTEIPEESEEEVLSESEFIAVKTEIPSSSEGEEWSEPLRRVRTKNRCTYENCGQVFRRGTHLDRHVYQVHTGIKKHACTYEGCDKRYIILTHLQRHIKTFHEKEHENHVKRLQCTVPSCERYLNTRTSLIRHIRQFHENPKIYSCEECEYTSRHKLQFQRHVQKQHRTEEKPFGLKKDKIYNCPECNEEFQRWSTLQKHRKIFHAPTCFICDRKFSNKNHLRTHLKDHNRKAEKLKFPCPYDYCERSYQHRRNLNVHINNFHKGIRFLCPMENCQSSFATNQKLNAHILLHKREVVVVERKPQAERKDKGIKKISTLSILTGIDFDNKEQKVDLDYSSFVTTSDSDGEEIRVPKKFHIKLEA
ncbi:transcription factor IIIA isoform X2 [Hermetia illucens]|nr:transcription factor IIIA isoform X2 [Hermetia illucens]